MQSNRTIRSSAPALLLSGFIAASLAALLLPPPADAVRGGSGFLSRDGRVGKVFVGKASLARVRRVAGRPTSSEQIELTGIGNVSVWVLRYRCGRRRGSTYYFDQENRLANFETTCRHWRTKDGTRVGDSREEAADNERKKARPPRCGSGEVITRVGKARLHVFFYPFERRRVGSLSVEGSNSVISC